MQSLAKRCAFGLVAFVFALVALATLFRLFAARIEPRYCGDAFDRIQLGMSQQDVESVFGEPEGDYNAGPFVGPCCGVGLPHKSNPVTVALRGLIWIYDDAEVVVGLDGKGQVVSVTSVPNAYRPPSLVEELRSRFKRVFRKLPLFISASR
jgi:hypothetical protein